MQARAPHSSRFPVARFGATAFSALLLFLFAVFFHSGTVLAQAEVLTASHEYRFGEQIIFRTALPEGASGGSGLLFIQVAGESDTRQIPVAPDPQGELIHSLDVNDQPVRAFSSVTYWFEIQTPDGQALTSERAAFEYSDNRFGWQEREDLPFRVHWYSGDVDFAQDVLDVAKAGLVHIQSLLDVQVQEEVDIYVYATAAEMQVTLNLASQNWTAAGHADPDLGVMVVALPAGPDQRLLMEQRIPHELTHILLYQEMGPTYAGLPTWLNEGLASSAELYPNPDYLILLNNAQQNDALLPIATLCRTFPRDVSNALLAYAQAASFTRYLHQQYGNFGFKRLIANYQNGVGCERGVELALESSLDQAEKGWRRAAFGENAQLMALKKLAPWMVLFVAAVAVPLGLTLAALRRKPGEGSSTARIRAGR
jgi:hypothetical protein